MVPRLHAGFTAAGALTALLTGIGFVITNGQLISALPHGAAVVSVASTLSVLAMTFGHPIQDLEKGG